MANLKRKQLVFRTILVAISLTFVCMPSVQAEGLQASLKCFHEKSYRFFDFKPLMTGENDDPYHFTFKNSTGFENIVQFDFCKSLDLSERCNGAEALANQYEKDTEFNSTCTSLTKKPGKGESVTLKETKNEKDEHLILSYETDTSCNATSNFGIIFEVLCDKDVKEAPQYERVADKSGDCVQFVSIKSKHGCKVGDLNGLWRFVEDNAWIFAIIFMVFGAFSTVLGRKLIRPTLFIIGTLTTMSVILFLFYVLILSNNVEEWAGWVILSCSLILGLIVGFFTAKLVRVGAFLLGAWGGAGIGLILSNMAFYKIDSVAVLWTMIAVLGLVLGVLSFIWFDYIVIFSTSVLGGYLLMRGLSLIAGGYPNEFTVYEKIRDGAMDSVPGTFYAYMAGILIIAILGIIFQIKWKKASEKRGKEYDYYKKV